MKLLLPLLLALIGAATVAAQSNPDDLCRHGSCFPVTGNLLIGRKQRLKASSTCGSTKKERFCIVSHLEEQTKCFYCDSRNEWRPYREPYRLSHRVENVVADSYDTKNQAWWQSENGVQNVTIQLDLEAEFHFTHLIMTYKSFRPAAMIIERSSDFGKTWQVYRYFAYDCAMSFPGIPEGPALKHTDVICEQRYSDVAPSTGGEIVYKVISPHIQMDDPYSEEISSLLKITNLRFNMTQLHTLGDDLLDYRKEITEKYYYAIYEIVVRGSCSCYGHAKECIPIDAYAQKDNGERADVVHGRCACTHNTVGLNCEKCLPFYNDHPWRPARGTDPRECKKCECHNHADTCHFDQAVYDASGSVSGGVCDDCKHNTQGNNCEQCKPYWYRDPSLPINDTRVCRACDCEPIGSKNDGICEGEQDPERELVAGKCYCKMNVDGHRCDRCKNGYWNLTKANPDGCVACTCHLAGTWNNEGCDKNTGACTCKRFVTGENCEQCLPEHYGMSVEEPDGCKPCDCDIGGALNNQCDVTTGQCVCRDHFGGRRCDKPDSSFYCANIDHYRFEAEDANITQGEPEYREKPGSQPGSYITWTGEGFARVAENSAISFKIDNLQSSRLYNLVLRYDPPRSKPCEDRKLQRDPVGWENVQVFVVRPADPSADGPCGSANIADDIKNIRIHSGSMYVEVPPVCLEAGVEYEVRVTFGPKRGRAGEAPPDRASVILIDSLILAPPTESLEIFSAEAGPRAQQHKDNYFRYQCRHQTLSLTPFERLNEVCKKYVCTVAAAIVEKGIECDCDPTGSVSGICRAEGGQCECKPNVVGRRCDKCAVGTYGFGPSGCTECACDSIGSLNNRCDKSGGQCVCRERGIYGRQCNQCQPGFWNFPDCATCQCNDHANHCDQATGVCIECRDLTSGDHCDRCQDGYYGDPRLGIVPPQPCKACPCPGGPASGFQHADTCYLDHSTSDVICMCRQGYTGPRCASCAMNHWGNPNEVGGTCERCACNGNIDMAIPGSCDAKTGDCLLCQHHSEGAQCEHCVAGYWGNAKQRTCSKCVCNTLGTNTTAAGCDRVTGQCPCFPNVVGKACDQCAPQHYELNTGKGCSSCSCDPTGVEMGPDGTPHLECNAFDGQCHCKRGRGGRTCSECENLFWGDPTTADGCKMCECDQTGAATAQCHRNNGTCICRPGSGGPLCNECARGYTGTWPYCQPCGECFHQWDDIVQGLKGQVEKLILTAANIEDTGVASAFDEQFMKMEKELDETKRKLQDANVDKESIEKLEAEIANLRAEVAKAKARLESIESTVASATQEIEFAAKDVKELEDKAAKLTDRANSLKDEANKIKQTDIQGAHNITLESAAKSLEAQRKTDSVVGILADADNEASAIEDLLERNRADFDNQYLENEKALDDCENILVDLEKYLPELNGDVCGAKSAPCDALCGGPGASCGKCGGQSCMEGAVSKAVQAKNFAEEASSKLNAKQAEAEMVLDRVREVLDATSTAQKEAEEALEFAKNAARQANESRSAFEEQLDKMNAFISANRTSPENIRVLAEEVLAMKIELTPNQIDELAAQIREELKKIENIDAILEETRGNKSIAATLEEKAERAAMMALAIKNTTDTVRDALKVASTAQAAASDAIKSAEAQSKAAREDLEAAKKATESAEVVVKSAEESLATLEKETTGVKVEYLQILDNAKSAFDSISSAQEAAARAEDNNKYLADDMDKVAALLAQKGTGKESAQEQAEKLRVRASDLLYKLGKYDEEYRALAKFDPQESMDEYARLLEEYTQHAFALTTQINKKIHDHATCET